MSVFNRQDPKMFERLMDEYPNIPAVIFKADGVKIHPTATLGESGFTWYRGDNGELVQIPNKGDIWLGKNVKIGEYVSIKRATLPNYTTIIESGSIVRNHANIAHNCKIGRNSWLGPHVCLNGSVEIGDECWIGGHAVIHQGIKIGDRATVGIGSVVIRDIPDGETVAGVPAVPTRFIGNTVHPSFKYGKNLKIGKYNHIHENVKAGDNCQIRSFTELRSGTKIGDDVYIDSGVKSSGDNNIGNRVTLRFDSIIARGCILEDDIFISPQLMTENISHRGEEIGGAYIGSGCFIGTNVTLAAGIDICSDVVIGSKTNVRKSITEPGIYIGNPARRLER